VVIPAYNCGQYIAQSVGSVFAQSFADYEVIVVNDGSPDSDLLEAQLQPFGHRINYLKQRTSGPSAARNAGVRAAQGKYVAFLDADDYWRPEHLSKLLDLFQREHGIELAYCDCVLARREKAFTRYFRVQPQGKIVNFDSLLLESCSIPTSTVLVSRDAVVKAGLFDESLRRCEDFDLWLRLAFDGRRMNYHPNAEVVHRVNESGLSANALAMKTDRIRVYEKTLANFTISEGQARTIRGIIAGIRAEVKVAEMKSALAAGDYSCARVLAEQASTMQQNWKLSVASAVLAVAPPLLKWVYVASAWILHHRGHESDLLNSHASKAVLANQNIGVDRDDDGAGACAADQGTKPQDVPITNEFGRK
jgi:glycosyltransferase involved in cell wall biosynthesis